MLTKRVNLEQGSKYLKQATELVKKGLNEQAVSKYNTAIEYFKDDPRKVQMVQNKIEQLRSAPDAPAAAKQQQQQPRSSAPRPISQLVGAPSKTPKLSWDDVAGLDEVKHDLRSSISMRQRQPQLFGENDPGKSILLYGPPGTGKSLLAEVIASQQQGTYFSFSSGDFVDKWQGESEQKIRAAFQRARDIDNVVVFFDEINSLASKHEGGDETQSQTSMKSELWLQFDEMLKNNPTATFVAATNKPWDIEPPVLRRFGKRVYIPLPTRDDRVQLLSHAMKKIRHDVSPADVGVMADRTDRYSGSDLKKALETAAELAKRELFDAKRFCVDERGFHHLNLDLAGGRVVERSFEDVPSGFITSNPVTLAHFIRALLTQKSCTQNDTLRRYEEWTEQYGQSGKGTTQAS